MKLFLPNGGRVPTLDFGLGHEATRYIQRSVAKPQPKREAEPEKQERETVLVAAWPRCAVSPSCTRQNVRTPCAFTNTRRSADCKSAIRQSTTLRYVRVVDSASGLFMEETWAYGKERPA